MVDSSEGGDEQSSKLKENIAKMEFIIGAILAFLGVPFLWFVEQRKLRCSMIVSEMEDFVQRGALTYIQGKTMVRDQLVYDEELEVEMKNCIRLYRRVEELVVVDEDKKWIEREGEITLYNEEESGEIYSKVFTNSLVSVKGYTLSEQQIEKMSGWEKVQLSRKAKERIMDKLQIGPQQIENNNVLLTSLKISVCLFSPIV